MTQARKQQIGRNIANCYHIYGRCVRQSYLFGIDQSTGEDYSHRRSWVLERLALLTEVFTIEIAAYAIMSNHYHICVFVDWDAPPQLSDEEVAIRWGKLTKGHHLVDAWLSGKTTSPESNDVTKIINKWRNRLADLSWFMKSLNEHIARLANQEENRKGAFWEGRFKARALLDEAAVLSCMTYVDLNPIRANTAQVPENSDFTSIQQRLQEHQRIQEPSHGSIPTPNKRGAEHPGGEKQLIQPTLLRFNEYENNNDYNCDIPCHAKAYFELVEWTGRCMHHNKRGFIPQNLPPILDRLNIAPDQWLKHHRRKQDIYELSSTSLDKLKETAKILGKKWLWYGRLCLTQNTAPS